MKIPAYAKINLFLEITRRRDDGFHDIETVFQTVSLHDDVEISEADEGLTLECRGLDLPQEKNLAWRAARLYFDRYGMERGLHIGITKHIPDKAGLAGGSADAAAVLRGLHSMYGFGTRDELLAIAAELGSDVPFCVCGGCMHARGRGEIMSRIPSMPDCNILLAKGDEASSTAQAYGAVDATDFTPIKCGSVEALERGDLRDVCDASFNRFEATAAHDGRIAKIMKDNGALKAMLSGSGSAVFGVFDNAKNAESAKAALKALDLWTEICRPMKEELL